MPALVSPVDSSTHETAEDRVAEGNCSPPAPTDPYVPSLEHTVPQIMVSLREHRSNDKCGREPADIAGGYGGKRPR